MAQDLRIVLQAVIDENSLKNIQQQIQELSKKMDAIKVDVKIDNTVFDKIKEINKQLNNLSGDFDINKGSLDKITERYKIIDENTNELRRRITEITDEHGRQIKIIERLNQKIKELQQTEFTILDNRKKQTQELQRINEKVERFKHKMLGDEMFPGEMEIFAQKQRGRYSTTLFNYIKTEIEALDKLPIQEQANKIKQLSLQWDLLKKTASQSANVLIRTFENAYKFMRYYFVGGFIVQFTRELKNSIRFINELDSQLTQIAVVTNQTRKEVAGLAKEYNNLAKQMKVTTSEIASGAVEFYRQGLEQEEVMERLRTTTIYSKIANLDFTQSAQLLTAAVNSMGIDIKRAADVFTYLGDATATGADEIGIAFSKTGGTAAALNVEFEKVASWIAVISSRTRESAESIGTSINTILSRMARITEQGFDEEDGTKINDVAKALATVGIRLMDAQGNFRNFGTIMDEIGEKWDKLDSKTKSYLATTIAGTRQQSRFYNLMEGYSEAVKLYENSLDAAGTAHAKYQIYLESNQAAIDKFKATMEGLWITVINSDGLMRIIKLLTLLTSGIDSLAQKFGSLTTAFLGLAPFIAVKFSLAIRGAYENVLKLVAANVELDKIAQLGTFTRLAIQIGGFGDAAKKTAISLATLKTILGGITLAITGVTLALAYWAKKSQEAKQSFQNALEHSQELNDEITRLEKLALKQEQLTQIEHKSTEQKQELLQVQRELAQLYPELATGVDEEGNKIAENVELTKQLTEEKKKLLEQELLAVKTEAETRLPQLRKELAELQKEAEEIQRRLTTGDVYINEYDPHTGVLLRKKDITEDLTKRLTELVNKQREYIDEINKLEEGVQNYNRITEERAHNERLIRAEQLQQQALNAASIGQLQAIENELRKLGFSSNEIAQIMIGNLDTVKEKAKEAAESIEEFNQAAEEIEPANFEEAKNQFQEITEKLQDYYLFLHEVNSAEGLSAQSKQVIIDKYRELLPYIHDEQLLRQQLIKIIAEEERVQQIAYANMLMHSEEFFNAKIKGNAALVEELRKLYNINLKDFTTLANAKGAVEAQLINGLSKMWQQFYTRVRTGSSEAEKQLEKMAMLGVSGARQTLSALHKATTAATHFQNIAIKFGGINFRPINTSKISTPKKSSSKPKKSSPKKSSTSKSEEPRILDTIEAEIRAIQARNDSLERTNELLQEQLRLARDIEGVQGLSEQYKTINKILQNNNKLIQSYKKEQRSIQQRINQIQRQYRKYNINSWFDKNAEATVSYIKQYNRASRKQQEEMEKVFNQVQKLKKAWIDADKEIQNVTRSNRELNRELEKIKDQTRDTVRELINLEKTNLELDLKIREREVRQALEKLRERTDKDIEKYQKRIKNLEEEIEAIQKAEEQRREELERAERLEEITKLQNRHYILQNDLLGEITEEEAKALELEREREAYLERQKKLQELLIELENKRNEKNIQQLRKMEDGTWQFEYVADERAIDELNKQIEELQEEHNKTIEDLLERTLEELKQAQESYDEWERQNRIRKQIEQKQEQIKHYQDMINDLQEHYNQREKEINEALQRERELIDLYYYDMELLTDQRMKQLHKTFGQNWQKIFNTLKKNFDNIGKEYNKLLNVFRSPVKGMSVKDLEASIKINITANKIKGYSKGIEEGLITRNQLAILHGTKQNWEAVFTKQQLSKLLKSAVLSTLNYALPRVSQPIRVATDSGITQNISVNMEFPNVRDAREIENAIKNLSAYATQWANRRK